MREGGWDKTGDNLGGRNEGRFLVVVDGELVVLVKCGIAPPSLR